jgi:MFS family permease
VIQAVKPAAAPVSEGQKIRALPWDLVNGVLTNIFYQWTFGGSVFVLFLNELGLPKGQIGTLLSLFPLCGLIALGFAPLATRLGRKRVFIAGYGTRYFVIAGLLGLPWVTAHYGFPAAVAFLFSDISIVALLRAMAETAYYPWTQEFIPNRVRGKFSAVYMVLTTIASAAALLTAGYVIGVKTGLSGYLFLIGAGAVLGFIGILAMLPVPGGAPEGSADAPRAHVNNMLDALHDRNLVAYLGGMAGITIGTMLLTSFLPLYVKEQIGLPAGTVVTLDSVGMVGGALFSLAWGWAADRVGSRPVLMSALTLSLTIPLGWLALPRQVPCAVVWCGLLYFIFGVVSFGVAIGSGRLLFNGVVPPEKSTAYTAIYYAWMGLTGGAAPLLAGGILTATAGWQTRLGGLVFDGHALLFCLSVLLLGFGWWLYGRVRPDDIYTTRAVLQRLAVRLGRR